MKHFYFRICMAHSYFPIMGTPSSLLIKFFALKTQNPPHYMQIDMNRGFADIPIN